MAFADADLKNTTLAGDMPAPNANEQSDDVRGKYNSIWTLQQWCSFAVQYLDTTL